MSTYIFCENPRSIKIDQGRWTVVVDIVEADKTERKIIISADHGVTGGDGIFVGTEAEYNEEAMT